MLQENFSLHYLTEKHRDMNILSTAVDQGVVKDCRCIRLLMNRSFMFLSDQFEQKVQIFY